MSLSLLRREAETMFVLSASGRIEAENEPGKPAGPRLFMAGSPEGNLVHVRHDVAEESAQAIARAVTAAPPWFDPETEPGCLSVLSELLAPVGTVDPCLIYRLPNGLAPNPGVRIVHGESAEGERLMARLARDGTPRALFEAGFVSVEDFWAPWCVAMEGEEIAAMAFAARLGEAGAEIGVYTFPGFRGHGLAAAVTAAWSSLPGLAGRPLFYSTNRSNRSSQRVAARLGLERIGASLRIT